MHVALNGSDTRRADVLPDRSWKGIRTVKIEADEIEEPEQTLNESEALALEMTLLTPARGEAYQRVWRAI